MHPGRFFLGGIWHISAIGRHTGSDKLHFLRKKVGVEVTMVENGPGRLTQVVMSKRLRNRNSSRNTPQEQSTIMTAALHKNYKTKLLVVDDDPVMVRLLAKVIERSFGHEMEMQSLTDGTKACDAIEKTLFDILVTDMEMPGTNGLGLLRCAKRTNALTQVFFITGHSSLDALSDALELGATDYLLKPLDQAELVELLERAQKRIQRWRQALAGTFTARGNRAPATPD
jgi:PleD family two-component response regulator